jgi:hypothetical protein
VRKRNTTAQSKRRDDKLRRAGKVRLAVWVDDDVHEEIGTLARILGLTLSQATERIVRRDRARKSGGARG